MYWLVELSGLEDILYRGSKLEGKRHGFGI